MKFSKLQLFAEAIAGKKIIYLYRIMQQQLHLQRRTNVPSRKMLIPQQRKMEQCVLREQPR